MQSVTYNGLTIPQIGLGTWPMKGPECERAVAVALEVGYRHIDTAQMYGNEVEVGVAIGESGVARKDIHITTKIWPDNHGKADFSAAVERSLEALGSDYVDLLLLHWPSKVVLFSETIALLNDALETGRARAIGISNFTARQIDEAVRLSSSPLSINQVEYHPFLDQSKVIAECKKHGLGLIAYCPIARGRDFAAGTIHSIAERVGKSAAQVVLRWHLQQGVIVVPKSATPVRIRENFEIFDFELNAEDMTQLSNLTVVDGRIVDFDLAPVWDD